MHANGHLFRLSLNNCLLACESGRAQLTFAGAAPPAGRQPETRGVGSSEPSEGIGR